ncbi:hypothetical protein JMJ56_02550 [Belnapia sp. T18]|uniref:Uncharacterized protein n=1 Tax=Belnapia arida TaxID=2804533 RepID=A0ABS1TYS1_9PROT|nr:hypothetical protein [Belnapia arida]MBL6076869.1 hypothetical protein [Belnapia arida]
MAKDSAPAWRLRRYGIVAHASDGAMEVNPPRLLAWAKEEDTNQRHLMGLRSFLCISGMWSPARDQRW